MSVRLYVGNLPKELERQELENLFTQEVGELASTKVVTDRKTGKCRGFGFVTVATEEQADQAIEKLNGHVFKDSALKIEKALPKSKETSQPSGSSASTPRRKGKGDRQASSHSGQNAADSSQPDPRWADDLEKLKELLLAQTNA